MSDVQVVLVHEDMSFRKLVQCIQEKFQSTRPLKLTSQSYGRMFMVDDEDWLLAQQHCVEELCGMEQMCLELWCFDEI